MLYKLGKARLVERSKNWKIRVYYNCNIGKRNIVKFGIVAHYIKTILDYVHMDTLGPPRQFYWYVQICFFIVRGWLLVKSFDVPNLSQTCNIGCVWSKRIKRRRLDDDSKYKSDFFHHVMLGQRYCLILCGQRNTIIKCGDRARKSHVREGAANIV